ncbi:DoxX family protein [Flavobacterium chuncheonense]|uniref:DoxX family protein n=1 Tax=Flavobacterium chuncheonense TaxID=2026653 RepID=A0ABW5YI52_9FLAO
MMKTKELNKWANAHTSYPIDLLRIGFGIFLFLKGVSFITEKKYLHDLLSAMGGFGSEMLLIHYVAMAHMVGGVMIVFGFLTRWSIWAQLPIVLCAFLINFIGDFNTHNFIQASIALVLCVFFLFFGSGKHSVDYNLKLEK